MKLRRPFFRCLVICGVLPVALVARNADPASGSAAAPSDAVEAEVGLISTAYQAAKRDDDTGTDAQLTAQALGAFATNAPSAILARRAAAVCGWLCNDNDYGRAMKVARRAILRLAVLTEATDANRAERLYWEAWLQAKVLDHKIQAIALLKAAEKLAPNDQRVTDLELPLVAAVAEFGR